MTPPRRAARSRIVHVAMFDAVNVIEPRYRPYLFSCPSSDSLAAAAAAAGPAASRSASRGDGAAVAAYLAQSRRRRNRRG
jgi:hypothetical protein